MYDGGGAGLSEENTDREHGRSPGRSMYAGGGDPGEVLRFSVFVTYEAVEGKAECPKGAFEARGYMQWFHTYTHSVSLCSTMFI